MSTLSSGFTTVESDVANLDIHKKSREFTTRRKASPNPGQVARSKEKPTAVGVKKRGVVREQDNEALRDLEPQSDYDQSRA